MEQVQSKEMQRRRYEESMRNNMMDSKDSEGARSEKLGQNNRGTNLAS